MASLILAIVDMTKDYRVGPKQESEWTDAIETSGVRKVDPYAQGDSFCRRYRVGRGGGVGRTLGLGPDLGVGVGLGVKVGVAVGVELGVAVAVAVAVAVGVPVAVAVAVGVGDGVAEPDPAQYSPPVFKRVPLLSPPQTTIKPSLPSEIAV